MTDDDQQYPSSGLAPESHYLWCCLSPVECPAVAKMVTVMVTVAAEDSLVSTAMGSVLEMDPEETKYLACPMIADDSLANGYRRNGRERRPRLPLGAPTAPTRERGHNTTALAHVHATQPRNHSSTALSADGATFTGSIATELFRSLSV